MAIHNFFNKVLQKNISSRSVSASSELNEFIDNDCRFLIKLPFLGKASKDFGRKLSNLILTKFSVQINVVYR